MDMNIFLFITNISLIILCGLLFAIMPRLTRKSLLFGVRIPQEEINSEGAKELKARYFRTCAIGTAAMLIACVVQYLAEPDLTIFATMYFPLAFLLLFPIAYIPNWKRAVALKEEQKWEVSNVLYAETRSSHSRGNLSTLPWAWYAISLVIIFATFVIAIMRYPELPNMIVAHFDGNFEPTRFVEKTWLNVLMLPLVNIATLALMIAAAISIEKAKLQIDQSNPRLSFAQHRVYRKRMGHSIGFIAFGIALMMSITWLPIVYPESTFFTATFFWVVMALVLIPVIFIIIVMIRTGQGGTKVKITLCDDDNNDEQETSSEVALVQGRGDDKYWKLGMFYYNPDDPAFIVEDRFGTNIGFNYGRPAGKIIIAVGIIGICALIAFYVWFTIHGISMI